MEKIKISFHCKLCYLLFSSLDIATEELIYTKASDFLQM